VAFAQFCHNRAATSAPLKTRGKREQHEAGRMTPTPGSARLAWAGLISFIFALSVGVAGPARANGYGVSTDPTLSYPVDIAGRQTLGVISVFGNDWYGIPFGDRYDRWRTGDIARSACCAASAGAISCRRNPSN
jgi:hypothetical protein